MQLLYRFSILSRLSAVVIAFFIPVGSLTYFMVKTMNANIEFAVMEKKVIR